MGTQKGLEELVLWDRWEQTLESAEIPHSEISDEIRSSIFNAYNQIHRHYHSCSHLINSFKILDDMFGNLRDFKINDVKMMPAIEMAIFFHDFHYDVKENDNEARSAQEALLAMEKLGAYIPSPSIKLFEVRLPPVSKYFLNLYDLIIKTSHQDQNSPSPKLDLPTKIFLDIDLAVLGTSEKEYDQYAEDIRKEYSVYTNEQYNEGRKFVLNSFLNRKIYNTQKFKEEGFEDRAKANIKRELERLK